MVFDVLNGQTLSIRSAVASNESSIGSDTIEILSEYEGSRFFSAKRHYQRSTADPSSSSIINMDTLQFNNIVLGNSDQVTMEARSLLSQWIDRADIDASLDKHSDKHSTTAVKEIIDHLKLEPTSLISTDMVICQLSKRLEIRQRKYL
jgi:hypothetical protein